MDLCCCSHIKELSLNRNYNASSFDDLPHGLIVDILLMLPVKTLVQSTCVCKLWYSIIKTPSFIPLHLSRSISDPSSHYTFLSLNHSPSFTVISYNPLVTRHQDFKFPFETKSTYLELIGACNGLICVTDSDPTQRGRDIYLTNPFIHKYKRLDDESSCYADLIRNIGFEDSEVLVYIGFGYSEVDDDYKVVRIITQCDFTCNVEFYSLKSGKWKALDVSIAIEAAHFITTFVHGCFVHGCLYWCGVDVSRAEDYLRAELLCFDLKDELFSRIELPEAYFQHSWTWRGDVFVKNGSLTIALCSINLENVLPSTRICLLVLEKKFGEQVRWKEFNYECDYFNPILCIGFGAMGLSGGGRVVFVAKPDLAPEYIVTVDLDNSSAIERLALDFAADVINIEATNVSESLVLLSD